MFHWGYVAELFPKIRPHRLGLLQATSQHTPTPSMEQQLGAKFEQILNEPTSASTSLQALSLARSLILNPSTSDSTISSLLQTLSLSLQPDRDPLSLRHTLSLLSDLAAHRRHLSHSIFHTVRSFSLLCNPTSTRTLAASLSVLASIAESNQTLASDLSELSESLFLKLCFFPSVSVRHWLLLNAERFWIRPPLLLTVFLGFTKDPYPYVRRVALDGLFGLCKSIVVEDCTLVESCYCRGVELLSDMEDCVRSSAVRAVTQWGQLLVALNHDDNKRDLSNALFIQLCSMVRDMNVKVRVEAFDALGEIGMVSEDILLQTLSKKVHSGIKGKTYPGLCSGKPFDIPASSAAGAILHGLEDEFCEVRKSVCHSIQTLSILSADFSGEALTLLVDVLNDDSMVVRLQALETMRCMALFDHLKVQETHMHMFLSTLVDSSALVRSAARNVLRVIKLNDIAMFKLSVDGLLENLEMYPQDEADVFSVIFNIGRCHGNFAVDITERVSDEIEPSFGGKLGFDSRRVAALLVLAISAPLSNEQRTCSTPQRIFSYAVTLLGRISHALSDVMDQNTLLAYLSHCSSSTVISAAEFDFKKKEPFLPLEDGVPNNGSDIPAVDLILEKVKDIWQLIQLGCTGEVLKTLRSWKNVLATFTTGSSPGSIAFMLQYLRVVKLMAKIWLHFISPRKVCLYGMGEVGLLLGKLDTTLREMRYRFIGLSKEEELHVLELILLNFILRLSSVEVYCDFTTLKNLHSTLSRVEFLHEELSIQPSNFVTELKKSLHEIIQPVEQFENDSEDVGSEVLVGPKSSGSATQFRDIKSFDDFTILFDGFCIDSELPEHTRVNYYELCRSKNTFIHARLIQGLNCKLVAGIICETVNIANDIRACKLTTSRDEFTIWEKTLKSFELMGMDVGFLRARVCHLLSMAFESEGALDTRQYMEAETERERAEYEIRNLEAKLVELKAASEKLGVDVKALKSKAESYEHKFQKEVDAPW